MATPTSKPLLLPTRRPMKALQQMTAVMRTSLLISSALAARASGFEYQNSYVVFLVKKKLRSVNPKR
ncbi:MAG: hypothetical protein GQ523_05175 [Methanophagales archaeon]|nr:hypothetical protein [Methanophagales archaeon]